MDPKELLIKSAEALEASTAKIAELEATLKTKTEEAVKLAEHIAQTKTAADKAQADADLKKADIAKLAKEAADEALKNGLIENDARRDEFATKLMDPATALNALKKVAAKVPAAKHSTVIPKVTKVAETADDVWNKHVSETLNQLGSR